MNSFDHAGMLLLDHERIVGPGQPYSLHIEDQARPWRYPEHGHRGFADFMVLERGTLHQRINGEDWVLHAGEAILIRFGDRHELRGDSFRFHNLNLPEGEWRRLAGFAGDELGLARLEAARTAPRVLLAADERSAILADLAGLIAQQGEGRTARLPLVRFLLRWLPRLAGRSANAPATRPAWLDPLLRRIEDGLGDELAVRDLPRLAGVSQAHLARSFRRHLGMSPSQHLNRARLRRAALRLARSEEAVLDIGYSLGFRNPSYFYRLFTRAYGLPPAAYRRRHRMP